jgi:hypothetical protein
LRNKRRLLVRDDENCHARPRVLERVLYREFGIEHTTLQVDHVGDHAPEGDRRIEFLLRGESLESRRTDGGVNSAGRQN